MPCFHGIVYSPVKGGKNGEDIRVPGSHTDSDTKSDLSGARYKEKKTTKNHKGGTERRRDILHTTSSDALRHVRTAWLREETPVKTLQMKVRKVPFTI